MCTWCIAMHTHPSSKLFQKYNIYWKTRKLNKPNQQKIWTFSPYLDFAITLCWEVIDTCVSTQEILSGGKWQAHHRSRQSHVKQKKHKAIGEGGVHQNRNPRIFIDRGVQVRIRWSMASVEKTISEGDLHQHSNPAFFYRWWSPGRDPMINGKC